MRYIVDITQLVRWQGRLTGIPRVMYEVARRFNKDDNMSVSFVVWNPYNRQFDAVDFTQVTEARKIHQEIDAIEIEVQRKGKVKSTLWKAYSISPGPVKMVARRVKRLLSGSKIPDSVSDHDFKFTRGDKLIVIWGDWGDSAYRHALQDAANNGIRLYQFAHDMLPLVTPQYSSHSTASLNDYVREVYTNATGLIAISKNTKIDVQEWMKAQSLRTPPIKVIRLGENFQKVDERPPMHTLFEHKKPYLLAVGTIEVRKNHNLLYYVYKLAKARNVELPPIVIVGRRGWLTEDLYELMTTDPDTKDKFIFLHDVSDEELGWLYENSLFSIYASHYEGWGLPVAESIFYGTPPLVSNTSSMPEIAGDLVQYFTPTSTDECLAAIEYLLQPNHLKEARNKIRQYKPTSWDETFEQIKGIIEK